MALTKLTQNLIDGTFGTEWVSTIQTSNFTAVASKGYFVNTTSQVLYVNLPVGVVGAEIIIQDYAGTFATNEVILVANGSENIQGVTDDFKCVTNNATVTLIYQDATRGWTASNIEVGVPPLTVDYLVVAGGAGGGGVGGGGAAGGYRTNYGGTSLTPATATNYTVTIGAGGVASATGGGANYDGAIGSNGGNSVFNTITSAGGGGGGSSSTVGNDGGSGGGARFASGGSGNTPSTTPSQGKDGGNVSDSGLSNAIGGGGGGASQPGCTVGNNGGNGSANSITGSAVTYAGGGGGGGNIAGSTPYHIGLGGTGGGGAGGANAGTVNTGSGGGGGSWTNNSNLPVQKGGNGGSGIVILRYPSGYTITGLSGTTTTVGTDKVTTFTTAGTGNIQFNT